MGLHKQLLLGSAAVIAGAAGAQAADLPSRKAAPVEYVRICDAYGAGFFYIPGTDTCLRVGGYIRSEFHYNPGHNIVSATNGNVIQAGADQDSTGMEMRGRIDVDARTQTNWGTVQTVVRLRGTDSDGVRTTPGSINFSSGYVPAAPSTTTGVTMERAYVRFAGFTAGVADENFSTMPSYMYTGNIYAGFPNGMPQFAYTATFGGGWSATLAVESRSFYNYTTQTGNSPGPSTVPTVANGQYSNQPTTGYNLVGNIRLDQPWGYTQLSGMVGNNSVANYNAAGLLSSSNNLLLGPKTYGSYAVGLAFRINLPMIAPGDHFHFMAAYASGADGLIMSQAASDLSDASVKRGLGGVIRVDSNIMPTNVTSTGGILSYGSEKAWGLWGIFTHYWAPDWRSNLAGGMAHFTPPTANSNGASSGLNTQWGAGTILETNLNLIWSPTKNFDIGIEAEYEHLKSKIQNPSTAFVSAGEPGLSVSGFTYVLRLERTF